MGGADTKVSLQFHSVFLIISASCLSSSFISWSSQPHTILSSAQCSKSSFLTTPFLMQRLNLFDPSPVRSARFRIISSDTVFNSYAQPVIRNGCVCELWCGNGSISLSYRSLRRNQWMPLRNCIDNHRAQRSYNPKGRRDGNYAIPLHRTPTTQRYCSPI